MSFSGACKTLDRTIKAEYDIIDSVTYFLRIISTVHRPVHYLRKQGNV